MSDTIKNFVKFISNDPVMLILCCAIIVLAIVFILVLIFGGKKKSKETEEELDNTTSLVKSDIDEPLRSTREYSFNEGIEKHEREEFTEKTVPRLNISETASDDEFQKTAPISIDEIMALKGQSAVAAAAVQNEKVEEPELEIPIPVVTNEPVEVEIPKHEERDATTEVELPVASKDTATEHSSSQPFSSVYVGGETIEPQVNRGPIIRHTVKEVEPDDTSVLDLPKLSGDDDDIMKTLSAEKFNI